MSVKYRVALAAAILCLLIVFAVRCGKPATPTVLTLASPAAALSPCEKCVGTTCYSAPCNLDCRDYGSFCETIVMAGGDAPFSRRDYDTNREGYDRAEFICQRVVRLSRRLEVSGVEIGDTVTHVNRQFADTTEEFAKLVFDLPIGTELRLIRNNQDLFITLK